MQDIICPNCKKAFKVDEAGFADILKQVHDNQFKKEVYERLELTKKDKEKSYKKYFLKFAGWHFVVMAILLAIFHLSKISFLPVVIMIIDGPVSLLRFFVDIVLVEEILWSLAAKDIIFHLLLGSLFWGAVGIIVASIKNIIVMIKTSRRGEKAVPPKSKVKFAVIWIVVAIVCAFGYIATPFLQQITIMEIINMVEITEFVVDGERLIMNGEINSLTPKQLKKVLDENPQITTIILQVIPGSTDGDTLYPMSRMVRERGLNTYLESDSKIDSGGVDFFLSGEKRTMERGAHMGVHSWSDVFKSATEYPKDSPEHEMNRKYIEDMLGEDDFYWFTLYAAPPDAIYEMTEEEIIRYGLLTEPIKKLDKK